MTSVTSVTLLLNMVKAAAMRDCVVYQWFTMIEKNNDHLFASQFIEIRILAGQPLVFKILMKDIMVYIFVVF